MLEAAARNSVEISGIVTELDDLRWTPSGLPVRSGVLQHSSRQQEHSVGVVSLEFDIPFLALGGASDLLTTDLIGEVVFLSGFGVYTKKRGERQFVLRVCHVLLPG